MPAKKPTTKDTTAPYTFKKGDHVRFDRRDKENEAIKTSYDLPLQRYGIGIVARTEDDGGVMRGHVDIWTGMYYKEDGKRKILHYQVPTDCLRLIDRVSEVAVTIEELDEFGVVDSIETQLDNMDGIKLK